MEQMERMVNALRKADAAARDPSTPPELRQQAEADARQLAAAVREQRTRSTNAAEVQDRVFGDASIEQQLGAGFDPTRGLGSFTGGFDLARTVSPEDREAKLRGMLPEGSEVRTVNRQRDAEDPGRPTTVYRLPGEENFQPIQSRGAGISPEALGYGAGFLATEENLANVGSIFATRGFGLPLRMGTQAVATMLGRATQEGVEGLRGYNTDSPEEIAGRVVLSGGLAAGGEAASAGFSRLGHAITPGAGGTFTPTPGVLQAQRAAEQEGLPALTLLQGHPLLARRGNQAKATTNQIQQYEAAQKQAVLDSLKRLRDTTSPGGTPQRFSLDDLDDVVRTLGDEITSVLPNPNARTTEGGRALQAGVDEFRDRSRTWLSNKYEKAYQFADDATFDTSRLGGVIDDIRQGTPVRGAQQSPSPIVMADGSPAGVISTPTSARAEGGVDPLIASVMDTLETTFNTPQTGREAADALVKLRTQVGDILSTDPQQLGGRGRSVHRDARKIYNALTDVIENPVSDNATFRSLWQTANLKNKWREETLDTSFIQRVAKSDTPEELMRFAEPGNATALRNMRRILPEERFNQFREANVTRMLSEPERIPQVLDSFRSDPTSLNLLFTPQQQQSLRHIGTASQDLNRLASMVSSQTDDAARFGALLDGGSPEQLRSMLKAAGGPNSVEGQKIRAGVLTNILDRVQTFDPHLGDMVADPRGAEVIREILARPSLRGVLQSHERQSLDSLAAYLSAMPSGPDVGASMAGASVAGSAFDILPGGRAVAGIISQGQNAFLARAFINPKVSTLIAGKGAPWTGASPGLRAEASLFLLMTADLKRQADSGGLEMDGRDLMEAGRQAEPHLLNVMPHRQMGIDPPEQLRGLLAPEQQGGLLN